MEIKLCNIETLYKETLDNGLNIYLVPMKNKKNYYISYGIKFGSEIVEFIPDGGKKYVKVPDGIAHFLEHKMFDQESGIDPFTFFSESGTDSNAATSYDSTQYICLGNKKFEENLKYLLEFVNSPYYTDENVNKEKGIIAEELNMYNDYPFYQLETRLRENIYVSNPRRIDIGGTVESINEITKDDLYLCYNNFYVPNNMFIIIVGDFNKEKALKIIKSYHKNIKSNSLPKIKNIKESDKVNKEYEVIKNSNINQTKVEVGLKINYTSFKYDEVILDLYLKMITDIKFGPSSRFRELIRDNKIGTTVCREWETSFNHKVFYYMANCDKPDVFIEEIKKEFNNKEILEEDFERIKKVWISNIIKRFDNIELLLDDLYDEIVSYGDIVENEIELIKKLKYKDLIKINDKIDYNNISIVKMIGD